MINITVTQKTSSVVITMIITTLSPSSSPTTKNKPSGRYTNNYMILQSSSSSSLSSLSHINCNSIDIICGALRIQILLLSPLLINSSPSYHTLTFVWVTSEGFPPSAAWIFNTYSLIC